VASRCQLISALLVHFNLQMRTSECILRDQVRTFNEKFTINLTKLDGTIATISNQ
jgi:hypothetical protein